MVSVIVRLSLSGLAGALMVLGFAPFGQWWAFTLGLGVFMLTLLYCSPWLAAACGLVCGLGYFGFGTSWVFFSVREYSAASTGQACAGTSLAGWGKLGGIRGTGLAAVMCVALGAFVVVRAPLMGMRDVGWRCFLALAALGLVIVVGGTLKETLRWRSRSRLSTPTRIVLLASIARAFQFSNQEKFWSSVKGSAASGRISTSAWGQASSSMPS